MGTAARHVDLRTATTAERVISETYRGHCRVCGRCEVKPAASGLYCPEGWEMAKQLASVRSDIRRLSAAAAVAAGTLF